MVITKLTSIQWYVVWEIPLLGIKCNNINVNWEYSIDGYNKIVIMQWYMYM